MNNSRIDFTGRNFWGALRLLSAREQQVLIVEAYRNGWISDWQLWDVLSWGHSPVNYAGAIAIYRDLNFLPFSGYPLTPVIKEH